MIRRHPAVPRHWLMTDERMGEALWEGLGRLPRGGGVVFRHHGSDGPARRALFDRVRAVARRRRLVLVLAGTPRRAAAWRADGVHGATRGGVARPQLHTAAAHDRAEAVRAIRAGADVIFVSPVFATRSHPGGRVLGPIRFGLIAGSIAGATRPVALGGMTARRFRRMQPLGAWGWAAIDAWSGGART